MANMTKLSLFYEAFYLRCVTEGFQLTGHGALGHAPFKAAAFTMFKTVGVSLCLLHVADLNRIDEWELQKLRDQAMAQSTAIASNYTSMVNIFLLIGKIKKSDDISELSDPFEPDINFPLSQDAEAFHGQSPYAVYWHLDLETQNIQVPPGQPDDLFGLRNIIIGAVSDSFLTGLADNIVPFPRKPHVPMAMKNGRSPFQMRQKQIISTCILGITNLVIMVLMYLAGYGEPGESNMVAIRFGAIVPVLIWEMGEYYRLITSMFVHFGWMHLFMNLVGLFIFGTRVERYYGTGVFLLIYFVAGISGSFASLFLTPHPFIGAGASGAIYGLVGAAFSYTRYTGKSMDMINNYVVIVYILMGMLIGFVTPNIGHWAHIGGLAGGAFVGYIALAMTNRKYTAHGWKM